MKEDSTLERFFSTLLAKKLPTKIPPTEDASGWSFERNPSKGTVRVDLSRETEVSMVLEIGRRMSHLRLCKNHYCEACLDDFDHIELKVRQNPDSVTEKLVDLGFLEIFQQVLRRYFKETVTKADDKSLIARKNAMEATYTAVVNMTHVSSEACRKIIQLGLHIDIINSLKSGHLDPRQENQSLSSSLCHLARCLIMVLYNVAQVTTEARELYLKQGVIEVIQRFRTGTLTLLSCSALVFLSCMISDKESFNLNANDEDLSFFNQELKSSLHEIPHCSDDGYKAVELLGTINKLVVDDDNKERFVKCGGLSSYVAFLEPHFDAEEQFLAAQGLWTLALKYAEEIKKENTCVKSKQ